MVNINMKIGILMIIFLLVSISGVLAFGISSPYWKDNPLKMNPGESRDVFFNLQNCPSLLASCGSSEENVIVSLMEGSEVTQITSGDSYRLPFGSFDTYVKLHVSIPESASPGSSYNVKFSVSSSGSGTGSVVLGTGYYVDFPVIVVEKSAESVVVDNQNVSPQSKLNFSNLTTVLFIAGLILLILVIYWIIKKIRG